MRAHIHTNQHESIHAHISRNKKCMRIDTDCFLVLNSHANMCVLVTLWLIIFGGVKMVPSVRECVLSESVYDVLHCVIYVHVYTRERNSLQMCAHTRV
jgi:hypothetical protein